MVMAVRGTKYRAGFTLIEVMIATVIFIIAVLGTSAYRYSAALSARRADLQTAAARTGLLLCEGWRGIGGADTYDPVGYFSSDLDIATSPGPAVPDGFTPLGSYKIVFESTDYYATLSWKDVSPGLRALNVLVGWDQMGRGTDSLQDANKLFKLTTYVEN